MSKSLNMSKSDAIAFLGLTKRGIDIINVYNFDTPQNEVWRATYIDGKGCEWAWLWGRFYRIKKSDGGCGYTVI